MVIINKPVTHKNTYNEKRAAIKARGWDEKIRWETTLSYSFKTLKECIEKIFAEKVMVEQKTPKDKKNIGQNLKHTFFKGTKKNINDEDLYAVVTHTGGAETAKANESFAVTYLLLGRVQIKAGQNLIDDIKCVYLQRFDAAAENDHENKIESFLSGISDEGLRQNWQSGVNKYFVKKILKNTPHFHFALCGFDHVATDALGITVDGLIKYIRDLIKYKEGRLKEEPFEFNMPYKYLLSHPEAYKTVVELRFDELKKKLKWISDEEIDELMFDATKAEAKKSIEEKILNGTLSKNDIVKLLHENERAETHSFHLLGLPTVAIGGVRKIELDGLYAVYVDLVKLKQLSKLEQKMKAKLEKGEISQEEFKDFENYKVSIATKIMTCGSCDLTQEKAQKENKNQQASSKKDLNKYDGSFGR